MAEFPLVGGQIALVDDDDLPLLIDYVWRAWEPPSKHTLYAVTSSAPSRPYMHRLILGLAPGDPNVDHRNGRGLDNRRSNLRLATQSQNLANARKQRTPTSSRYKGVHLVKKTNTWAAQVKLKGKTFHISSAFATEEEAARAYDEIAFILFGEFARLNFPEETR